MNYLQGSSLLKYVVDTSHHMSMIRELTPLLQYVMEEVLALVKAEKGYVVLFTANNKLDFRVARNSKGEELSVEGDGISQSILSEVIKNGKSLVLSNALSDPRFAQAYSVMYMNLRSVMCVPLMVRDHILGAIYVENRSIEGRFRSEDAIPL
ncbi:MAG: GAF domain-containing protein, partial [Gammaproteobacteria bacterium]|nr:GAF domain-containing protein [Gammaproteobacteria bacterium]